MFLSIIFKGKHITTNKIESKHSQFKGAGEGKKQRDKRVRAHIIYTTCVPRGIRAYPIY